MLRFQTWIRLSWMASIAISFTSCDPSKEQGNTDDSVQTPMRSKHGDRPVSLPRRTEFESELKTVEEMDDPAERSGALAVLATDAMMDRPDLAQLAILKLPADSPALPGLLRGYLSVLLNSESADALAWADSLEDKGMASMARELLAALVPDEQLAAMVPRALDKGKIAAAGFKPGDELMLQRWASLNPKAAAAWLANMPAGETRNQGFLNLSQSLVHGGDETATNWLNSLPTEGLRTNAREAMAAALLETPEPIREALLGPPDSQLRQHLGGTLAQLHPAPPEPDPVPAPEPASAEETAEPVPTEEFESVEIETQPNDPDITE